MNPPPARTRGILHVVQVRLRRIGGVERELRELSLQMASNGWTLTACVPAVPQPDVSCYLQEAGVKLIAAPEVFRGGVAGFRSAYRLFRTLKPEILHLNFVSPLSLLPWAAKLAGVRKVLFTDHSSRPEGFEPRRATLLKRLAGRAILLPLDQLVSVSDYVLRCNLTAGYCAPRKHIRVYNPTQADVPLDASAAGQAFRARFNIPPECILATQVSWLIPEKGVFDLLRSARLAVDRNPNIHFVVVGDGPSRGELERLRESLGMKNNFTFAGLIMDPIAEGVYAATDIACQFSRWQEAFGWTIAEAMSQGRPVVGSLVGGIPELVEEGETGYLVPAVDPAGMAERILQLAESFELRRQMGEAGARKARQCFDLATNTSQLMEVYGLPPLASACSANISRLAQEDLPAAPTARNVSR